MVSIFIPEDGGCMFPRNIGIFLQFHTLLQPRRLTFVFQNVFKLTGIPSYDFRGFTCVLRLAYNCKCLDTRLQSSLYGVGQKMATF
jgi:hypothetical protein